MFLTLGWLYTLPQAFFDVFVIYGGSGRVRLMQFEKQRGLYKTTPGHFIDITRWTFDQVHPSHCFIPQPSRLLCNSFWFGMLNSFVCCFIRDIFHSHREDSRLKWIHFLCRHRIFWPSLYLKSRQTTPLSSHFSVMKYSCCY